MGGTYACSRFHDCHGTTRLSNEKASAIFKIKGAVPSSQAGSSSTADTANIGILCEPIANVQAQVGASVPSATPSTSLVLGGGSQNTGNSQQNLTMAMKCARNFLNYVSSFAQSAPSGTSLYALLHDPSAQSALIGVCERWYKSLESKTAAGIDWLNREQD